MSRRTRPLQYLDANNNVIPYEVAQDAIRVSYEGGSNVRYYGTARPNETQESNADYENKQFWRIYRLTYDSSNNIISKYWANGGNDNELAWDNPLNFLSISAVTQANPGVVTLSSDTWPDGTAVANGDKVEILSAAGMTELNGNFYYVSGWNAGLMTFNLHVGNNKDSDENENENTSGYGAYTGSGIAYKRSFANYTYN